MTGYVTADRHALHPVCHNFYTLVDANFVTCRPSSPAPAAQVAANEEICREFTDDGGVMSCLQVLR